MRKARRRAAWLTPSKLGNAVLHKSDRKDCEVLMKDSIRWKLLKRIVFIEVIRCKDNIAILCIIPGNFFFMAKKLELSIVIRVIPTF